MVFGIAWHYLHDRGEAEEVAQDVFLQFYKHLDGLESREHAVHWLRRAAANRAIDYGRRRRVRPQVSLENVPELSTPADPGDPFLGERLRQLVASLPEKARMVVVLRYQEDLELDEIARILEIPVGTVKSQLQRALAMLREKACRTIGVAK